MMRFIQAMAPLCALVTLALPANAQHTDPQDFTTIERGKYLVTLGDCVACHTAPGGQPFAGGRAIATPFGTLLSPNLTPDRQTGIGDWSDDQFVRAMQHGIGADGEHLYPAFPYVYYTKVTRQDDLAIRTFLATLPPVRNAVKTNQLPFPFSIRADMIAWDALYFKPGVFQPDPHKSAVWNRGAYIVQGLGHCAACHTPKGPLGGDEDSHALQGYDLSGWVAPNLTPDSRRGLGAWPIEAVVEYLKTGRNEFAAASGPMAEVVGYSTSHMTDDDLWSIATYLKDQPAPATTAPARVADTDPTMEAGAAIYADNCAACHTGNGAGIQRMFPALAGQPSVQQPNPASLIGVVLRGAQAVATHQAPTGPAMPSFAWKLNDDEIADVLTYIRNSWGNAAPAVAAGDVKSARKTITEAAQ
jgi:mono/diheme cytochrome c family protein